MVEHTQTGGIPVRHRSAGQVHEEMLQPGPVDAVITHPLEMAEHSPGVVGTEQLGLSASWVSESRRRIAFHRGILSHVRPHLEGQEVRRDPLRIAAPMNPPQVGCVIRAAEPALVTAHHLAPHRRGIHRAGAAHGLYHGTWRLMIPRASRQQRDEENECAIWTHGSNYVCARELTDIGY